MQHNECHEQTMSIPVGHAAQRQPAATMILFLWCLCEDVHIKWLASWESCTPQPTPHTRHIHHQIQGAGNGRWPTLHYKGQLHTLTCICLNATTVSPSQPNTSTIGRIQDWKNIPFLHYFEGIPVRPSRWFDVFLSRKGLHRNKTSDQQLAFQYLSCFW